MSINYANWMTQTLNLSKTLKQISIPGSHDTGMYISTHCSGGGSTCNTQTQDQPMLGQLEAGMRYFDLRPLWASGVLYTGHFSYNSLTGNAGCNGGTLIDIFNDVNSFLSQGYRELVILKFSHYFDRDTQSSSFTNGQFLTLINLVTGMLGSWLYVNNTGSRLADIPLSQIIGSSGKVFAVFDELPDSLVQDGIYHYTDYSPGQEVLGDLSVYDNYSNTNNLQTMQQGQLANLDDPANHGGDLFLLSWTLTQSNSDAVGCLLHLTPSIIELAQEAIASVQSELASHTFTSSNIPNVVYLDVSPTQATEACIDVNQRLGNNVTGANL